MEYEPSECCDSNCNLCLKFDKCKDRQYDLDTEERGETDARQPRNDWL